MVGVRELEPVLEPVLGPELALELVPVQVLGVVTHRKQAPSTLSISILLLSVFSS